MRTSSVGLDLSRAIDMREFGLDEVRPVADLGNRSLESHLLGHLLFSGLSLSLLLTDLPNHMIIYFDCFKSTVFAFLIIF